MPRLAFLAAALAACSSPNTEIIPLRFDVPITDAHRSLIIAIGDARLEARNIDARHRIDDLAIPVDTELDITVLAYERTLEELRISSGPLAIVTGGEPLPETNTVFTARAGVALPTTWSTLGAVPAELTAIRIMRGSACGFFTAEPIVLDPATDRVAYLVAVQNGVVAGTSGGHAFFVERGRATPLESDHVFLSAYADGSGGLILGDDAGKIFHGTIRANRLDTTEIADTQAAESIEWIAGPAEISPHEIYVLAMPPFGNNTPNFRKIIPGTPGSELIHSFPWGFRARGGHGGVAYVGEGEAVAGWINAQYFVRTKNGATTIEDQLPEFMCGAPENTDGFSAVAQIPGMGTIGNSFCGATYQNEGVGWKLIKQVAIGSVPFRWMAPYDGGFAFADDSAFVGHYHRDAGFCDPFPPGAPADKATRVVAVGRDLVAAGDIPDNETKPVVRWLTRTN